MTNDASLPEATRAGSDEPQHGPVLDSTVDKGTARDATQSLCVQERPRAN